MVSGHCEKGKSVSCEGEKIISGRRKKESSTSGEERSPENANDNVHTYLVQKCEMTRIIQITSTKLYEVQANEI